MGISNSITIQQKMIMTVSIMIRAGSRRRMVVSMTTMLRVNIPRFTMVRQTLNRQNYMVSQRKVVRGMDMIPRPVRVICTVIRMGRVIRMEANRTSAEGNQREVMDIIMNRFRQLEVLMIVGEVDEFEWKCSYIEFYLYAYKRIRIDYQLENEDVTFTLSNFSKLP